MHIWPNDGKSETYPRPRVTRSDYEAAAVHEGLRIIDRDVQVGDLYLAGRNTGIKLLTAKRIHPLGWIEPTDGKTYYFDTRECLPVERI